jgi:hypothetical protein
MLEIDHMFDGRDEDGQHNNRVHMHEIIRQSADRILAAKSADMAAV